MLNLVGSILYSFLLTFSRNFCYLFTSNKHLNIVNFNIPNTTFGLVYLKVSFSSLENNAV